MGFSASWLGMGIWGPGILPRHSHPSSNSSFGTLALVPASYTASPASAHTNSTPFVPREFSLHCVQSVSDPRYAFAMASSTESASTVLVNSVTSYANAVYIILISFRNESGIFHDLQPQPLRR